MNKIAALAACLLLCACETEEEAKAKWVAFCVKGDFSSNQCEVLYSIKKSSDDANSTAATATALSAGAMGAAAASGGYRR